MMTKAVIETKIQETGVKEQKLRVEVGKICLKIEEIRLERKKLILEHGTIKVWTLKELEQKRKE